MAVTQTQPEVRLSVADGSNSIGHFGLWIRASASASAAQGRAALAQLRSLLPTDCSPVYGLVRYQVLELDQAHGAGDRTRCAVFVFETTAPGQLAVIVVPGLKPHLVDTIAPLQVDMTSPAVIALIVALQAGPWCSPFGYPLGPCIAAIVEIQP